MRPSRCQLGQDRLVCSIEFHLQVPAYYRSAVEYYCTVAPAFGDLLQLSAPPTRYSRPHQQQPAPTGGAVMRIGVPKEIKVHEYRIGLVRPRPGNWSRQDTKSRCRPAARPASASRMRTTSASARRSRRRPKRSFDKAEMIVKVKEPQPKECAQLRKGQVLYTYLHLAPDRSRPRRWSSQAPPASPMRRSRRRRLAAAAHADERSRRPHVGAGRCVLPAES